MILSDRSVKAIVVVLSTLLSRKAFGDPPSAAAAPPASPAPMPNMTSSLPPPALPAFGLSFGSTSPALTGLTALWSTLTTQAAARVCSNHCPPPSSLPPDGPMRSTTRMISGPALALGAAGGGLALGSLLLRMTHKKHAPGAQNVIGSLSIEPMAGGAKLSFHF